MISSVGVGLFNVAKCGYFTSVANRKNGMPEFGGLSETMTNLASWVNGRKLSETCTFDVPEDSELTRTYLLGIYPANRGDYLVCLWNRIISSSNNIASVGLNDVVGRATAEFTEIDEDRIPGYATYFWFMPQDNKVATIRVKHASNGLGNLKRYIDSFLSKINPEHVILGDTDVDAEIVIAGYRSSITSNEIERVSSRFRIESIHKVGDTAFVIDHAAEVTKIICKSTLSRNIQLERNWWQAGLDLFGLGVQQNDSIDTTQIKLEIPISLDSEGATTLVETWQEKLIDIDNNWDDIGFVIRGETSPHWLSKSYARKPFDLDIEWINEELVDPQSLITQLQLNRSLILALGN